MKSCAQARHDVARAESNRQLACKGSIGAKSLDRELGSKHNWPHSRYLMRQYDGGGWGKARLNCRLCRCRCMRRCISKINGLMKIEERARTSILPVSWPFCSRLRHPLDRSFPPTLLCSDLRFPKIALVLPQDCRMLRTLFQFRNCAGCTSTTELQFHCRVITLGLTKWFGCCELVIVSWPLWVGCYESVAVDRLLWAGRCGLLWHGVGRCGLIAVG